MKIPKELNRRNLCLFGVGMILVLAFLPIFDYHQSFANSPTVVQTITSSITNTTTYPSASVTFTNPVVAGDIIIVVPTGAGSGGAFGFNVPTSTDGSFALLVNATKAYNLYSTNQFSVSIYGGIATSSSSDTITVTTSSSAFFGIIAYELSGVSLASITTISTFAGSSIACGCLTNSISMGALEIAGIAQESNPNGIFIFTSSFSGVHTILTLSGSNYYFGAAESSTTATGSSVLDISLDSSIAAGWAEAAVIFSSSPGCPSCAITTGTSTYSTTDTTVINGTTYFHPHNVTTTFTSTLGSTFVTTQTISTRTTETATVLNAPNTDTFQFWAIPLMFNFIIAMLFVAIPAALKVNNSFLYGLLFFTGLMFGGIFGLLARVTPWYDPVVCALAVVAIIVTRAL